MDKDILQRLQNLKKQFHLYMNGVGTMSMKQKGVNYRLNYGIPLPRIEEIAQTEDKDFALASALWKEEVRECKILSFILMPVEAFDVELADVWMDQTTTMELSVLGSFYLYRKIKDAKMLALRWISRDEPFRQIAGFNIFARNISEGMHLTGSEYNELYDQAQCAMESGKMAVRNAAAKCMERISEGAVT